MRKSKLNKFVVQSQKYWWVGLGVVVIFLLVIGLVVLVNTEEAQEVEVVETTEIEEPVEAEEGVRFTNAEFVEKFIGEKGAEAVVDIEEGVYGFLDEGSYTAFAAGSDVERGVSFPFSTLEFVLQVSNGENFEVQIALLKDAYFGVLIGPADGEEAKLMVEHIRPGEEAGYEEGEAVGKLRTWAAGLWPGVEILE